MGGYGLDSSGSVQESLAGTCERDYDPSGSIKYWEILEQMSG
jgi:hypothetical protein